ncbi:MAG: hypothetical protein GTO03_15425, partial [Planctomycetales bacterium]|nr:hypothetical protein [Planctomycetales bacterium]
TESVRRSRERACRAFNVFVSSALLVLTAPLMLVIAVAIRLTSSGPILYTQPRVGISRRNGGGPVNHCHRVVDHGG